MRATSASSVTISRAAAARWRSKTAQPLAAFGHLCVAVARPEGRMMVTNSESRRAASRMLAFELN